MGAAHIRTHSSIFAHFFFAWILDPGSWTSTHEVFFLIFFARLYGILLLLTSVEAHCFTCVQNQILLLSNITSEFRPIRDDLQYVVHPKRLGYSCHSTTTVLLSFQIFILHPFNGKKVCSHLLKLISN